MAVNINMRKAILPILLALVNTLTAGLAAGRECVECNNIVRTQFEDAVIFGLLILNYFLAAQAFIEDQEFHKYWRLIVYVLGAILFLIAGILALHYVTEYNGHDSEHTNMVVAVGLLCLVMVVLYIVDIVLLIIGKE